MVFRVAYAWCMARQMRVFWLALGFLAGLGLGLGVSVGMRAGRANPEKLLRILFQEHDPRVLRETAGAMVRTQQGAWLLGTMLSMRPYDKDFSTEAKMAALGAIQASEWYWQMLTSLAFATTDKELPVRAAAVRALTEAMKPSIYLAMRYISRTLWRECDPELLRLKAEFAYQYLGLDRDDLSKLLAAGDVDSVAQAIGERLDAINEWNVEVTGRGFSESLQESLGFHLKFRNPTGETREPKASEPRESGTFCE